MSFLECVTRAVEAGEITEEVAGEAMAAFRRVERRNKLRGKPSDKDAPAIAAQEAADKIKKKAQKALLTAQAQDRLIESFENYRTFASGNINEREAAVALFDSFGLTGFGIDQVKWDLLQEFNSNLNDFFNKHAKGIFGQTRDGASLRNLGLELFGGKTGDAEASAMAKAIKDNRAKMVEMYNEAGGNINVRADYNLPQYHNWTAVRAVPKEEWVEIITDAIDVEEMSRVYNMSDEDIIAQLPDTYDKIATDGASEIDITEVGVFKPKYIPQREANRFFIFKSFDDWEKYNAQFGEPDVFKQLVDEIEGFANDIAAMKVFGPNPEVGVDLIKNLAMRDLKLKGSRNRISSRIDNLWDNWTGRANEPEITIFGKVMANIRSGLVSTQLGAAIMSATTDPAFVAMASHFANMAPTRSLKRVLQMAANKENRNTLARAGYLAETLSDSAATMHRFHDEANASPFFQRLSASVIRAQGLSAWTDRMREGFIGELMGKFTDMKDKPLSAFVNEERHFSDLLERARISADDWDVIRATKLHDAGEGVLFLRSQDIRRRTDIPKHLAEELSFKYSSVLKNTLNMAVPTASFRARTLGGSLGNPGTIFGELTRSAFMYKNFPLTVYLGHMRVAYDSAIRGQSLPQQMAYPASLLIMTTGFGALALQLKTVTKGNEPDDMTRPDFWTRAMMQGGGLGIWGDFLIRDHTRYGHSMGQVAAGPVAGAMGDLFKMAQLMGEAAVSKETKDKKAGAQFWEALAVGSDYVPGRNLWYFSAAWKRIVQDNLRAMGDKQPERRFKRMQKRRENDFGGGFFWKPGDLLPFQDD